MRTRRKFLLNCSAVAVTASVTPASVFAAPRKSLEVPLEQISLSSFASNLNTLFRVQGDNGPAVTLQLIEVSPTPAARVSASSRSRLNSVEADAANEKFSLLFRGALNQPLEQDTYWFESRGIGRFAMFIVPIGSTETTHVYYEAIFNRPASGPAAEKAARPNGKSK